MSNVNSKQKEIFPKTASGETFISKKNKIQDTPVS